MKYFNLIFSQIILLFAETLIISCKQKLKTNEFNIYVSEDNPGWHFVDLANDTIHKGYHRIDVKFAKGQKFQTAFLRSELYNYKPTFLSINNDTVKTGLWFLGEYTYDSLQRRFLCYYMPTEYQRKTINDYIKDSSYASLRYEMDTIVENYLQKQGDMK